MPLTPGQIIHNDRYRIDALLGQGGMGAVYRGWDITLNIPVAIKENLDASPEAQKQFGHEAHILASLSHPNLPRVTDYFFAPGQGQYLVMDYIEGEDLQSMLNRLGALPEPQVLNWISQVCDALAYLHNQPSPIVHRDVKPANIKIRPDGRAVLVDFGIAKVYDPRLSTTIGAKAITPGYSPPEQYGGGTTDGRSDVYALGATLYHLLTGQQPPESVQRLVGSVTMPLPRQINQQISPTAEQAILKAIEVATDRRFQNVDELRKALTKPMRRITVQPTEQAPQQARPAPQQARPAPQLQSPSQSLRRTPRTLQPVQKPSRPPWLWWAILGGLGVVVVILAAGALITSNLRGSANPTPAAATKTLPATEATATPASEVAATEPTPEATAQLSPTPPPSVATTVAPTSTPLPPTDTPTPLPPTDTPTLPPPTDTPTPLPPTNTYTPSPTPDTSGPSNAPEWGGGWSNIVPDNHVAQIFTAKSTKITAIEVALTTANAGKGDDTITMMVMVVDGHVINVVATVSRSVSEGFDGWARFQLPNEGVMVTPGQQVIIELADTGKIAFGWKYGSDTYADGSAMINGASKADRDFFFRVNPSLRIIQPVKTLPLTISP
ncbi:MAG: protein kinase [Anaerolineae bacterium]|nr:protein kinase [Anaerolineae bacterium]